MSSFLNKLRRRATSQDGAYTVEFLASLTVTLMMIALVVQLVMVLLTAVIFNNALQTAAQEASVQGGPNSQVDAIWLGALPDSISNHPSTNLRVVARDPISGSDITLTPGASGGRRGQEQTNFGDLVTLRASYQMDTPMFGLFGSPTINFNKSAYVSSQSAQED